MVLLSRAQALKEIASPSHLHCDSGFDPETYNSASVRIGLKCPSGSMCGATCKRHTRDQEMRVCGCSEEASLPCGKLWSGPVPHHWSSSQDSPPPLGHAL